MLRHISHLPSDLLLYVLSCSELNESIFFCLTCKRFSSLLQERSFWISHLRRKRREQPIACLLHHDLSASSLAELKYIALHTLRLEDSWLSTPQTSEDVPFLEPPERRWYPYVPLAKAGWRTSHLHSTKLDILFILPGTPLYVLHERGSGLALCWDASSPGSQPGQSGQVVAGPIWVGDKILDVTPGRDEEGVFSMGLLVRSRDKEKKGSDRTSLAVLSLSYGTSSIHTSHDDSVPSPKAFTISLDITFQKEISTVESDVPQWAIFWNNDVIGLLVRVRSLEVPPIALLFNHQTVIEIWAVEISSGKMLRIRTDITSHSVTFGSGTTMLGEDLYIVAEERAEYDDSSDEEDEQSTHSRPHARSTVFRCPGSYLRFTKSSPNIRMLQLKCAGSEARSWDWEESFNRPELGRLDAPTTTILAERRERWEHIAWFPMGALSSGSGYSVPAVSMQGSAEMYARHIEDDEDEEDEDQRAQELTVSKQVVHVRFWTVGFPDEGDHSSNHQAAAGSRKTGLVAHGSTGIAIPGHLVSASEGTWQLMVLSHSGRHIVMLTRVEGRSRPVLWLASFRPEAQEAGNLVESVACGRGNASARELEMPEDIDPKRICGLALDDSRGVIGMLDDEGMLHELFYA